jgi:hypothetical protein
MLRKLAVISVIALLLSGTARAQQFDGVWTGQAGQWSIKLTVAGAKGKLALSCGNDFSADIPVSADGSIDSYVSTGQGRRQITGKLPKLVIPPGGSCGGGSTDLKKQ